MNSQLEKRLRFCRDLPTLPTVALRIIELGNDPDVELGEVADTLALDPALAAKLLRVANSPIYGLRRKTDNLRQALTLLGLDASMTLALGFSLSSSLRSTTQMVVEADLYWRRSLLSAVACRALGARLGMSSREELFLAGLLQDIGMLALTAMMPSEYAPIIDAALKHERLIEAERKSLSADHAEVGAWLLRSWRLPEYLPLAVMGSHEPSTARAPRDLAPIVPCVAVSGRVADIFMRPDDEDALRSASRAAQAWLGMDEDGLHAVLDAVAQELPEISELFDIELMDMQQVSGILDQSKELLVTRHLQMLKVAAETQEKAERFEFQARTLEEQGRRDPLTGLYNRKHLDTTLATMFRQATERGWPLTLAFIDLDHFKRINDTYGHQAGDAVLVGVAGIIASQLRQTDLIARFGGEEFVVLLPNTPSEAAGSLFGRLLKAIEGHLHVLRDDLTIRVTATVGVATHREHDGRQFGSPEDLVRAADRVLYAAKRAGRNRVMTLPELDA